MSEPRAAGPVVRTHLAAARGDGGSSRQTGRTVTGEGWEAELSGWGRARPRGPQEGNCRRLRDLRVWPRVASEYTRPEGEAPEAKSCFPRVCRCDEDASSL